MNTIEIDNQFLINQLGENLLNEQKTSIKANLLEAFAKYHHPNMKLEEIQTIIGNVADRTEQPDIAESIRVMML